MLFVFFIRKICFSFLYTHKSKRSQVRINAESGASLKIAQLLIKLEQAANAPYLYMVWDVGYAALLLIEFVEVYFLLVRIYGESFQVLGYKPGSN